MTLTSLTVDIESWPRTVPLRITGYTHRSVDVVVVTLERAGKRG